MKIEVLQARQRAKEYYFQILVNSDLPPSERDTVEFHYGLDTALADMVRDFKAYCHNTFEPHVETPLTIEGNEYDI